jgi:hypothetical protein
MKLKVVDDAIALCVNHLAHTGTKGAQIDLILANYLAVSIHAAFEQEIERMIENRANQVKDTILREFMMSCVGAVFRSTGISELTGLLGRFGDPYKELFKGEMAKQTRAATSWDSIVARRHGTAHVGPSQVFVHEVEAFYEYGHLVLDAFKIALDATTPVCAGPVAPPGGDAEFHI